MKETVQRKTIIQVEWICFYRLGERGMNKLKAYARQKVLSWGLSMFPLTEKNSPQTEVGHSSSRKFDAQLPDLPLHFLGLFLTAFLERQGFILADKRTKKDVLVGFLRPGVAVLRWRTHDLLPLDRKDTQPTYSASCLKRLALGREWLPWNFPVSPSTALHAVDNQRVTRSLETTVLPEMRTRQPATELALVFSSWLAGKKHGLGTNLFFFYTCPA